MKGIYFGENRTDWNRVYYEGCRNRLKAEFSLPDRLYSRVDLGKEDFSEVEVLFSTWGISALSEGELARYFPALKAVFYAAGSVQAFARPCLNKGVRVFSAWQANAVPVVEYSVAQIVLANKGFYSVSAQTKSDYGAGLRIFSGYKGNYGAKIGILGDGAIGSEVIRRLLQMNLEIYVFSITMSPAQANALGVRLASLQEIFGECDVISNHLANNEKTCKIINKDLLDRMRDYTTLINTGRGAQIDEEALVETLRRNPTVTVVLDVTDPEPPLADSPLYKLPNVVLTPHIAGSAGYEVRRMADYMCEESIRFKNGELCKYEVSLRMLETMA